MNAFMGALNASNQLTKLEDSVDVTINIDYEFSALRFYEGKTDSGYPFDVPAKRWLIANSSFVKIVHCFRIFSIELIPTMD
ncbi:hypothetical protein HanHA300_Chr13g0505761 [Helianthus annuus]|nr:hypothetical protein HanHA300_Chr13g0505761 [Helianthus annuus]KAJ0499770.1 hypothetical protein HanHA89_Chr13g0537621 [Helianthus annuus]KAJ0665847.1 hypothetical protein HanLR1_Chr13g0508231 [Helianthus annuus]KAJ0851616.1 hypothetical protein HanPSC8_Chr13g0594131 [Helianthus annuus]KAJ0851623.1 hypothetical protein HanPSC8_Chr13g0594211 [Helianthus annuus]